MNEDENRNLVVEGAIPHKASNRGAFNVRFGQPDRLSGTQHTERQFPGAESPQTWGVYHDRISDVKGGQLDRCRATETCPKIMETFGGRGAQLRAAPVAVRADGDVVGGERAPRRALELRNGLVQIRLGL